MKVYIHTDIEGVAGWTFFGQHVPESPGHVAHALRMNRLRLLNRIRSVMGQVAVWEAIEG